MLVPNPFFGGVLFPGVVFGMLYAVAGARAAAARGTAASTTCSTGRATPRAHGARRGLLRLGPTLFVAGAADRIFVTFGIPYSTQVWFFRVAAVAFPVLVYLVTSRLCRELAASGLHPLRDADGHVIDRRPDGSFVERIDA